MKADIVKWSLIAKMRDQAEGRVVLLDGGLVTIRKIGVNINETAAGGKTPKYMVDYRTPWGDLRTRLVRGDFLTALVYDPDITNQEGS